MTLYQLQGLGVIACILLAAFFAALLPWALRRDWSDYHLFHGPDSGCAECEDK